MFEDDTDYYVVASSYEYDKLVNLVIEVLRDNGIECDTEEIAEECVQAVLLGRREGYNA